MQERPLQIFYLTALHRCAELALRVPEPEAAVRRRRGNGEDTPQPGWLERQIVFIYSQIRETAEADQIKPFSNERFEDEIAKLMGFSRARPQYVLHETEHPSFPSDRWPIRR